MSASYVIKYGNRLYLSEYGWTWTHDIEHATYESFEDATELLVGLKRDTNLYEARIVHMSDIAIVVENVP